MSYLLRGAPCVTRTSSKKWRRVSPQLVFWYVRYRIRIEFLSGGQYDLLQTQSERTIFTLITNERNLVARLHGVPAPAPPRQYVRTIGFADPGFNLALVVLDRDRNFHMRIDELVLRYRSLYGYHVRRIVSSGPVMRHHGEWNHEQNAKGQKNRSPIFHVTLPGNLKKSTALTQSTSAPAFPISPPYLSCQRRDDAVC